jgi:hypothetical protein
MDLYHATKAAELGGVSLGYSTVCTATTVETRGARTYSIEECGIDVNMKPGTNVI